MSQAFYDYVRGKSEVVPDGYSSAGMSLYRYLVNLGASQMIEACHPLLRDQLGEEAWGLLIKAFVSESQWSSNYYGELENEFTEYLDRVCSNKN